MRHLTEHEENLVFAMIFGFTGSSVFTLGIVNGSIAAPFAIMVFCLVFGTALLVASVVLAFKKPERKANRHGR